MKKSSLFFILMLSIAVPSQAQEKATYGPIKTGDMLWNIAAKVRQDSTISRYQAMLALHKANPDAFDIPCNLNSLKMGHLLYIPSRADMQVLSKTQAVKEFYRQNKEWKAYRRQRQKIICLPPVELPVTEAKKPFFSITSKKPPITSEKSPTTQIAVNPATLPIAPETSERQSSTESEETVFIPISLIWENMQLSFSMPLFLPILIGGIVAIFLLFLLAFFIGKRKGLSNSKRLSNDRFEKTPLVNSLKTTHNQLGDTPISNELPTPTEIGANSAHHLSHKMQEKLDNVRAYLAEDEEQMTQKMLREVLQKGTIEQQSEARQLYEINKKINYFKQHVGQKNSISSNSAWQDLEQMGEHWPAQSHLPKNQDRLFELIDKIFELLDYELNAQGKLVEAYFNRSRQDYSGAQKNYEIVEKPETVTVDGKGTESPKKPRPDFEPTRHL